jgi:acetylornithine deacetylase
LTAKVLTRVTCSKQTKVIYYISMNPISLTQNLIRIESTNPTLVRGGTGETAIAQFVQHWLEQHGFVTHWLESTSNRSSVVGVYKGIGGGRSLMLNGHLDTVTLEGYDGDPLAPIIKDGKLYGRGSYDMKSGVAAMLVAAARAVAQCLRGDVVVACVADEEDASLGTEEVLRQFKTDAGVICEPTELELVTAHKGFVWASITTHGVAAHGSRPNLGVDAIAKMGRVLTELGALDNRLQSGTPHPLLGTGSLHASIIAGGQERSSYPAQCILELERRTIPGESADTLRQEIETILETCCQADPHFRASYEIGLERQPLETPKDAAVLEVMQRHAGQKVSGASYWADAALMQAAGIDTVMLGVIGSGAHAALEWAEVTSIEKLTETLTTFIVDYCG